MQTLPKAAATVIGQRRFGGQSMVGHLKSVIVRPPVPAMTGEEWKAFGYPNPVDQTLSEQEHAAFRAILADAEAEVIEAAPGSPGLLDAIFGFDPSIVTDAGAILLRLGKPERLVETDLAEQTYAELNVPILGRIEPPGTVEGGDTLWLDERTLAVGRGYRTNDAGIAQLATILSAIGVTVIPVALPHWRGPGECLHLMSLISPVAADLAVVYLPLLETAFVEEIQRRSWRLVEVPNQEFDSLGCNVLALAPKRCLMCDGNPTTRSRLEAAGCEVGVYQGREISLNRAGGPTCLTRPLWRATDECPEDR